MNFISIDFIVFVGLVHVVHWRLRENRSRKRWLTAASYAFYALWDWRFCGLMLLVTANAWWTGRTLPVLGTAQRRRLLAASIALDLAVLGFFKYFNFFTVNLTSVAGLFGERMDLSLAIILPIGISFYTFHAISYVVDVQRGKVAPVPDFSDVALYISFFPQLIAGPIVRASFFMPQMAVTRRFHFYQQIHGIQLFIRGVLYKAVIADLLARVADPVSTSPRTTTRRR
jgi:alginate O-acetyltransferase complex protein AlgI